MTGWKRMQGSLQKSVVPALGLPSARFHDLVTDFLTRDAID